MLTSLAVGALVVVFIWRFSPQEADAPDPSVAMLADCTGALGATIACAPPSESPPPSKAREAPCPQCGQDENFWRSKTSKPPPELLGKAAALVDAGCGRLILGKSPYERLPPASLVKMATALAVVDAGRNNDLVNVTINGWDLSAEDGSSIMGLEAGMQMTVEELLWGLLLASGNDAAVQLGLYLGGEQKILDQMNQKAAQLGLQNTQFRNLHGLDAPGQYSSAFDLTVIGRAVLDQPLLSGIVSTQFHQTTWNPRGLWNGNWLMYIYPDVKGVKTGYTEEAGGTIVAAAQRDGRLLVTSVLNSADVYWDSLRLFNWAFDNVKDVC